MTEGIKIVQIQTSPDGRVVALGENGRAYWYQGQFVNQQNEIVAERWNLYPELPTDQAAPLDPDQF